MSGVPVIVPHDAAIAEFVEHGVSGYCYEFGVDGLAAMIGEALASPARGAQVAANARQLMVDRWSNARFADAWQAHVGSAAARS